MKRYLPSIEMKGEPEVFNGALEAAQEKLVDELLGTDLEELLEERLEPYLRELARQLRYPDVAP